MLRLALGESGGEGREDVGFESVRVDELLVVRGVSSSPHSKQRTLPRALT